MRPASGLLHRAPHCPPELQARPVKTLRSSAGEAPAGPVTSHVRAWRERHPDAVEALRACDRARHYARPAARRAARQARERAVQALTLEQADNHRTPWTDDDERLLLDHQGVPAQQLALELGRTLYAVQTRRLRLRARRAEGASGYQWSRSAAG